MIFNLKEPKLQKETLILIQYYVKANKRQCRISTKLKIHPDDWDFDMRMPKKRRGANGISLRWITNQLMEIYSRVNDIVRDYGDDLTISNLKKELGRDTNDQKVFADDIYDVYLEEKKTLSNVTKGTLTKYRSLKAKFDQYEDHINQRHKLTDLKSEFWNDFIKFLRQELNIHDNTLDGYINAFKTFLRWASKQGYQINDSYKDFVIGRYESDQLALTFEDVKKLEDAELSGAEERARDLFLVGIYSGQRFSDFSKISKDDLQDGFIIIRSKKTDTISYIPLTESLERILIKYDWELPKISSQKFNKRIQMVCKKLEFTESFKRTSKKGTQKDVEVFQRWQIITSHTARRTFITLSKEKNLPDHLIMKVTGHRSLRSMHGYARFNKEALRDLTKGLFD
jgi:site-specific recombinase XerD